ncbi:Non-specific lipid-transfer protein-like protein [Zea mays]|uniref:Non-specific lipid-transfer protein-like protein n=1 Tax=Zea mays TaxID=4577 RepID=A0A3L6D8D0_MAIZE|nr:Non-specific lipid-transfer protein-like protein [Zea mays]
MANRPSRSRLLVLALAVAALLATTRVEASTPTPTPAPAPGPSADCTDALLGLAGCLGYVQEGSTAAAPDPSCCSGLRDVVRGEVACLCQLFQGGQDFGLSLNMTRALQLPAACKVKTPPVSKCHVSVPGVPSASPGISGSLVRGPRLRAVADAVAVNPFGITGSNPEPDQRRSSALPSAFRRCRPLGTTTGLHLPRCRDSVGVPDLVSWAHSPEFMRSARTTLPPV